MKLENDELVVWKDKGDMIFNGEVVRGILTITNRRLFFQEDNNPRSFIGRREQNDLWDLDIWKVMGANIIEMSGMDYPMIRINYKEHEVFFTFPDKDPRQTLAGIIVFINHARMIERIMGLMKSVEKNLKNRSLEVGERTPDLIEDIPHKADENCYQCGKTLLEDEMAELNEEYQECLRCIPNMR